jgi:hypothetical protein
VSAEIFERYVDAVLILAVEANGQIPGCDSGESNIFGSVPVSNASDLTVAHEKQSTGSTQT